MKDEVIKMRLGIILGYRLKDDGSMTKRLMKRCDLAMQYCSEFGLDKILEFILCIGRIHAVRGPRCKVIASLISPEIHLVIKASLVGDTAVSGKDNVAL